MGGRSRALAKCHIVIAGSYKEYPAAKVSGWIANLGGSVQTRPNENTTHVVASVNAWNRKDASIQKAQELNEERATRDVIKIVSFDWLVDCADNKTKKREGPYLCEKLYVSASKRDAAKKRQEGADGKEKKGHVGMMAEVFQESTEGFVDDRERKRVEKQIETEKRVREEMEREERDDQRKKTAELFGKGAKKARNEIFTENHHIYTDDTGFKYDILLTKVDTRQNRNERVALTLQIYESNALPHTYATNCQFAGTKRQAENVVLVAIGTPFATAFRAFRKVFKERTGVEWDDRISHAIERAKREKRERGLGTGSEAGSAGRKGVAVSEQGGGINGKGVLGGKVGVVVVDFEKMPFEYHPPRFGSRGKLPQDKSDELAEKLGLNGVGGNERVESWMSGANGAGAVREKGKQKQRQKSKTPDLFAELMNTPDGVEGGQDLGGLPAPAPAPAPVPAHGASIYDHELNEILDQTYPFDPTLDWNNFDLGTGNFTTVGQTNEGQHSSNTASAAQHHHHEQEPSSFTQPNTTTENISNLTQNPISFDALPPSTVNESFQPGTQEVGETQIAERAAGEFEEFINAQPEDNTDGAGDGTAVADAEMAEAQAQTEAEERGDGPIGVTPAKELNFGSFMLKRKTSPAVDAGAAGAESEGKGHEGVQVKKLKTSKGEDVGIVAATAEAAEAADTTTVAEVDESFVEAEQYPTSPSNDPVGGSGGEGEGSQIPRTMQDETKEAATATASATEAEVGDDVGFDDEMVEGRAVVIE